MEKNKCLYCENELKGRSDKVFCDSACKSAYHNKTPNTYEAYIKGVNKQLRKNRSALRIACPQGKATVRKEFLTKMGMNFKHITHTWKGKGGQIYFFCYDYGYSQVDDHEKVLVIQEQEYM